MRSTDTHAVARARQIIAALLVSISLSAGNFSADSLLLDAYKKEDMSVWKEYVDRLSLTEHRPATPDRRQTDLLIEYGYCGYIVAEAKKEGKEALLPEAKRYVQQFKTHIEALRNQQLPAGHYEMYRSAVLVFELRLHESIHPVKSMSLAKEAVKLAPNDPIVLTYYGTCLFYAPKPFGSKEEALTWFEKADKYFRAPQWKFCWLKEANSMYIKQCKDKLQKDKK